MERLRNMGLRRSFFLLSAGCLAAALLLTAAIYSVCDRIGRGIPRGGIAIAYDGVVTELEEPSPEQLHVLRILGWVQTLTVLLFPVSGLGIAGVLFYRWKLKEPIRILKEGTERIRMQDLDFSIPVVSADELGGICAAFETMRGELQKSNQELWRQAEERRRLNAAFAHDLRNPVTVLKGTVKQLRRGGENAVEREQALKRLETYTLRIERYVEAMSSIQRLEQMPVRRKAVDGALLRQELEGDGRAACGAAQAVCPGICRRTVCGQGIYRSRHFPHCGGESDRECGTICTAGGVCLPTAGRRLSNTFRRGRRPGISGSASKRRPETFREGFGGCGAFWYGAVQQSGALREAWRRTAAGKQGKRGGWRCADNGGVW